VVNAFVLDGAAGGKGDTALDGVADGQEGSEFMISISTGSAMPGTNPLATSATASFVSTASTPMTVGHQNR
jgi:hypothetical protein